MPSYITGVIITFTDIIIASTYTIRIIVIIIIILTFLCRCCCLQIRSSLKLDHSSSIPWSHISQIKKLEWHFAIHTLSFWIVSSYCFALKPFKEIILLYDDTHDYNYPPKSVQRHGECRQCRECSSLNKVGGISIYIPITGWVGCLSLCNPR